MKKTLLLLLIALSMNIVGTTKFYYLDDGINLGVVVSSGGPFEITHEMNDICEAIINVNTNFPEDTRHLKLNGDGTLKCPPEIDAARVAIADSDDADRQAMKGAKKSIDCGLSVKSRMLVQNASKSLTDTQKINILSTYSTIDALLSAGSLATARVEILAVTADGVMVTEADKTALVAELDLCD